MHDLYLTVKVGRSEIRVTRRDVELGASLLRLVCDWGSWIERRVDSFEFAGDDERVLQRSQSIDLVVPAALEKAVKAADRGAIPVPLTFMNKWRLPQFSLRDEAGRALPLLARQESTPLSAGMLLALANFVLTKETLPAERAVPRSVEETLVEIAAGEFVDSMNLCARLDESGDDCASRLACDETFMSLAYELARGFPLMVLLPLDTRRRRVVKVSYASYVLPARPDPLVERLRHLKRAFVNRSWDYTETSGWAKRNHPPERAAGELTLWTQAQYIAERLREREGAPGLACVLATIRGPHRRSRTVRLRPNSAVKIHSLPPGGYSVTLSTVSGFKVTSRQDFAFVVGSDTSDPVQFRIVATRSDITARVTKASPRITARAWIGLRAFRSLLLNNKPLAIRVRMGHGGSYHNELVAPEGLHVTRARLVSNAAVEEEAHQSRVIDVILESNRRSHLYAPAEKATPAAGYAYLHLRPRFETIGRAAFLTACIATAALAFVAITWHAPTGYRSHGPDDGSALLVVILGAPSALAAYFVQGISSRVTTVVLSGLRLAAAVPSILTLAAAGVLLVGEGRTWSHCVLWVLAIAGALVTLAVGASGWVAEHPGEQSRGNQGPGFRQDFSREPPPESSATPTTDAEGPREGQDAAEIRARLLMRADGMAQDTRRTLLAQHNFIRHRIMRDVLRREDSPEQYLGWRSEAPPSLYFDSAETNPTFLGLHADARLRALCGEGS